MKLNRKNRFLLIGFAIALYICYSFAISNTIKYYREYQDKNAVIANYQFIPELKMQLFQKEKQLNFLLAQHNVSSSDFFQNSLLKQLNSYSSQYNLKVIDFKEPHIITENNTTTSSYIFSLQGSFNGSIALLNKLENQFSFGSLYHINFSKKKNYKSNADELTVEVILQKTKSE